MVALHFLQGKTSSAPGFDDVLVTGCKIGDKSIGIMTRAHAVQATHGKSKRSIPSLHSNLDVLFRSAALIRFIKDCDCFVHIS